MDLKTIKLYKILILAFAISINIWCDPKLQTELTTTINHQTQIIKTNTYSTDISWSPDGGRLAFTSHRKGTYFRLSEENGENESFAIIDLPIDKIWDISSDKNKIVFSEDQENSLNIYDRNNNSQTTLSEKNLKYSQPSWSPDGRYIAYTLSQLDNVTNSQIWICRSDGTEHHQMSEKSLTGENLSPSWAPDSQSIVFSAKIGTNYQICTISLADNHVEQITSGEGFYNSPVWSPDGKKLPTPGQKITTKFFSES